MTASTSANINHNNDINNDDESMEGLRQRGNHEFSIGNYDHAVMLYTSALERCAAQGEMEMEMKVKQRDGQGGADGGPDTYGTYGTDTYGTYGTDLVDSSITNEIILNACNRSACYYLQEDYAAAQQDASTAWELSHYTSIKAAFRLAKTEVALQHYQEAKATIQLALQVLDRQALEQETAEAVDKMKLNIMGSAGAVGVGNSSSESAPANSTPEEQEQHYKKLLAHQQQQRQSLQDLYQQVLEAAYSKTNNHDKEEAGETTIKFAKRPVSIREFTKGEALGYGNFSEICVVTHTVTKEVLALKMIPKKQAADLAKRQHPNVYNEIAMERRVLLTRLSPHPNIVQLYHAFQDYNTLYYLMDLHTQWSDLWTEIQERNSDKVMVGCHRTQAKVWMYELVDACQHMHAAGIVHRDLKPENILINGHGHVVVIDFGTSKDLIQTDLNGPEFVGTPDFMPPEAVNGTSGMAEAAEYFATGATGATHTADLWQLGAVAYILETGVTPFWSVSQYMAFLRIKRCLLQRPIGIADDETWDFIQSLMQLEPVHRLGADAFELVVVAGKKDQTVTRLVKKTRKDGYDVIRNHAYFTKCREDEEHVRTRTPIPSLRDLCIRATADLAVQDSLDLQVCDQHPPGDGSKHDMTRLSPRDQACVLHVLDRRKMLREHRVYARFFKDAVASRLDKVRPLTRDFVGLTQMNDDQGKAPNAKMNDPYATPIPTDPIQFVSVTNPLLVKEINEQCDEGTRKKYTKLFKKCIANINRSRPKMVVVAGFVDEQCRKLLARISESIPVVVHDGSAFFTFWMTGVQCIAVQSSNVSEESAQMAWLREHLEQVRMSKHPFFIFCDTDPRDLPAVLLKRLTRGRALCLMGVSKDATSFDAEVSYTCNEATDNDDASIRSDNSEEDDRDSFTMKMQGTQENGLRWITIDDEPDKWDTEFKPVELPPSID